MIDTGNISGTVGLVTALAQECACARKALGDGAQGFALVQSGMGRAAGYIAAEELGRTMKPLSGLVSLGFCGALSPSLSSGTVVIPEQVVTGETGEVFKADERWHAVIMARLGFLSPNTETLYSAREVISTAQDKRQAATRHGAGAVDMESAGIAHAAARLEVPFLAIRIVLDEAEDVLPAATADAVKPDGNLDVSGLVGGLLRRPQDVPALMALGRKSTLAQKRLTAVCEALQPDFGLQNE